MNAFEMVLDTALDEFQIEIVENDKLPLVVNERLPFHFQIDYKDNTWYCEGHYQCRENPDEFVTIRRAYTNEMIGAMLNLYEMYEDLDEESDNPCDVVDYSGLQ